MRGYGLDVDAGWFWGRESGFVVVDVVSIDDVDVDDDLRVDLVGGVVDVGLGAGEAAFEDR